MALVQDRVQQMVITALGLQSRGRAADAKPVYRQVLARHPGHFDATQLLGLAEYQTGNPAVALKFLNAALKIRQDNASVFNHRGLALRALGETERAIADFGTAIRLKPGLSDAYYNRANALRQLGRLEEALADYRKALQTSPGKLEYLINCGGCLKELGRLDGALDCYDQALRANPGHADCHVNRAMVLHELERYAEAVESFAAGVGLGASSSELHVSCGNTLVRLGRHVEAIPHYDEAIRRSAGFANAYAGRGHALKKLGRMAEALADYERASLLNPADADISAGLGGLLRELNRLGEALASFDRAISLRPDQVGFHVSRGAVLRDMNRLDEALDSYGEAIRLKPGHAPAFAGRGRVHASAEHWEQALADFEEALRLDPANDTALSGLSLLPDGMVSEGRLSGLLRNWAPSSGSADEAARLFVKANLLRQLGRYAEAFDILCQANELRRAETAPKLQPWRDSVTTMLASIEGWKPAPASGPLPGLKTLLVILGPSRAGKTTLERIICRSSDVRRGFEGSAATVPAGIFNGIGAPGRGATPPPEAARLMLEALFSRGHEEMTGSPHGVITVTNPFLISVAHRIFDAYPQAVFVFLQRDPVDTASEIFAKDYRGKHPFAYSAAAALEYVETYSAAAQMLHDKMGPRALMMDFADIAKPGSESMRRLLLALGTGLPEGGPLPESPAGASPFRPLFAPLIAR